MASDWRKYTPEFFRRCGRQGGKKRAENMTPEERHEVAKKANAARRHKRSNKTKLLMQRITSRRCTKQRSKSAKLETSHIRGIARQISSLLELNNVDAKGNIVGASEP